MRSRQVTENCIHSVFYKPIVLPEVFDANGNIHWITPSDLEEIKSDFMSSGCRLLRMATPFLEVLHADLKAFQHDAEILMGTSISGNEMSPLSALEINVVCSLKLLGEVSAFMKNQASTCLNNPREGMLKELEGFTISDGSESVHGEVNKC